MLKAIMSSVKFVLLCWMLCITVGGLVAASAADLGAPVDLTSLGFDTTAAESPLTAAPYSDVAIRAIPESLWQFNVGTAILTRGTLAGSPIMIERFPTNGNFLLTGSQYRFDWAAGPDISGVRQLGGDRYFDAVDFRYFDVQAISAATSIDTDGIIWKFPPGSGSYSIIQDVQATYGSELYSFEANLRRQFGDTSIAWLTGFRWIQADDAMSLVGTGSSNSITWDWDTQNNLYGWQLGAIIPFIDSQSRWSLSCTPKAGVYGNQCVGQWSDQVSTSPGINSNGVFRNQVSFVGDLSATLGYRISKRCALTAGYQLLWLNGIAVAADQPVVLSGKTIATGLNSSGSAFYHGALAGVNFNW